MRAGSVQTEDDLRGEVEDDGIPSGKNAFATYDAFRDELS